MTDLTPERRDKMRRAVTECAIPMGSTMWPVGGPTFLALLDAADERDALAAAVERMRVLHSPGIVFLHADECGHGDGDGHAVIEGLDGDLLCFDSPTDDRFCVECVNAWDEPPAWPCATIRALDGTDV